ALGARAQGRNVGARPRLGYAQRADLLAADRGHEVALLLLLGAELPDRRRGEVHVRADARRRAARPHPCEPLPPAVRGGGELALQKTAYRGAQLLVLLCEWRCRRAHVECDRRGRERLT